MTQKKYEQILKRIEELNKLDLDKPQILELLNLSLLAEKYEDKNIHDVEPIQKSKGKGIS